MDVFEESAEQRAPVEDWAGPRSGVPVVGRDFPRVAEVAGYGHGLDAVAWGHAGEHRAAGAAG
jgi:hypothetical protein